MLETTKDVLFIVLSFCILWITVFLCWALYHLVNVLRNSNKTIEDVNEKFNDWSGTVDLVQEKVEEGIAALSLISSSTKALLGIFGKKMGTSSKKRKTEKTKNLTEDEE